MISQNSVIVQLQNVSKVYNGNEVKTAGIKEISLTASLGELLLILGPSGSGKTTLLTLIAGLIEPTEGKVLIFNRNIKEYSKSELQLIRATKIGFVFQTFLLIESLTVAENIKMVLTFASVQNDKIKLRIRELLETFGIDNLADKVPSKLSQGEKQRAALARAIANNADLILADEPTASLESQQGFEIIKLLHSYAKNEKKCVIVVSHDLRITEFADRILRIEDGRIV